MDGTSDDLRVALRLVAIDGAGAGEEAACARAMTDEEGQRRDRFKAPGARLQYVVSRALLRTSLSLHADVEPRAWRFAVDAYGKPRIVHPLVPGDLHFNLSHTDGLIALAVTEGHEIGVDVENTRRDVEALDLARTAFAPREIVALERLPTERHRTRFFDVWVLKEAYAKARGLGVSLPFPSFAFDLDDPAHTIGFTAEDDFDASAWRFELMTPSVHHVLALAARCRRLDVEVRWIEMAALCAAASGRRPR